VVAAHRCAMARLPTDFGPWKTVFNRFGRWAKTGKWQRLFLALQTDGDDEWHSVDSTINRAHQHASGGQGGRLRRA
jgi:transposase